MLIQPLLEEFCQYALHIRGVSPETIKRYTQNVSYFYRYTCVKHICDVTKDKVLAFFLYGRIERSWTPRTYRTYHMSLLVFFRWCVSTGHMESNYLEEIELPKIPKSLPKALSRNDAEKLLEIVYNYPYTNEFQRFRNHAIFSMFILSGLRRKELLNLKYSDISLENRTIFINSGKGGKDRYIPICTALAHILERYLVERRKVRKTCPEFFTSSIRNSGITLGGLIHIINTIKKASNISFGSHVLRHTFATSMLEGGCDIFSLSEMMGHSDIRITTVYMFASRDHLQSQVMKHPLNNYASSKGVIQDRSREIY